MNRFTVARLRREAKQRRINRRNGASSRRRLLTERLEDRNLLAAFVVNSLADNTTASDGFLTLREAIIQANGNGATDTIGFSVAGTINISSQLPSISTPMTIDGNNQITIDAGDGSDNVFGTGDGYRIFSFSTTTATLDGLTLTGGDPNGSDIFGRGGAIYSSGSSLTILNSTIADNAANSHGGGIASESGSLHLLTVKRSTISGNVAGSDGGGIWSFNRYPKANVQQSTISGNTAGGRGGGIFSYGIEIFNAYPSTLDLASSTITNNSANQGGGLFALARDTINVTSSIVAGNTAPISPDVPTGTLDVNSANLIGGNPILGPLAYNGGPTQTHALLQGGPAINTGSSSSEINDQRGAPFTRNAGGVDKGALERQTVASLNLVVDTTADENDGVYSAGDLSLREAIGLANGSVGPNTITFSPSLFATPQSIVIASQLPRIVDTLTIAGPGANLLTIDARGGGDNILDGDGFRILEIDDGTTGLINVSLSGLTLTGGDGNSSGGAIFSRENLTIDATAIVANRAKFGGGIATSAASTTTITNSTIAGNIGFQNGGGVSNGGSFEAINVTISGNQGGGGAIVSAGSGTGGSLNLTSSTVTGNTGPSGVEGIWFFNTYGPTTANFNNTIIDNPVTGVGGNGTTLSGSHNLFAGSVTISGSNNDFNVTDPMLGPLADNGGPTQTHALLLGSQAINTGSSSETNDQRGAPFARNDGGGVDRGAYERQTLAPSFFVVNTTLDEFDYSNADVSLREAIYSANGSIGADTITFDPSVFATPQSIVIASQLPRIVDTLTITGPGANLLTIDARGGGDNVLDGDGFRILEIDDGTTSLINVSLSGLTLTGGDTISSGGAIFSRENLTIDTTAIVANRARFGGGIGSSGESTTNITNSTIAGNIGFQNGGGVSNGGSFEAINVTISGNQGGGGAIVSAGPATGASLKLTSSTVTGNTGPGGVEGIWFFNTNGPTTAIFNNTIIDNPVTGVGGNGTTLSGSHNLFAGSVTISSGSNNDFNVTDPMLGPLADNGGPTQTHALLLGSQAINTGSSSETNDQRGAPFARNDGGGVDRGAYERQTLAPSFFIVNTTLDELDYSNTNVSLREAINSANGSIGADTITLDAGVFSGGANSLIRLTEGELQITESLTIDASTGVEVVISGDASGDDTLLPGSNITDVAASSLASQLGDNSRVLNFTSTTGSLTIQGLTVTGGRTTEDNQFIGGQGRETIHSGGGIRFVSSDSLTLTDSTVSGNSTAGGSADGGGISTRSGNVSLTDSEVSGNSTTSGNAHGGGISTDEGDVSLTSSTVSGNSTAGGSADGGGISTRSGNVSLTDSEVSGNSTTSGNAHGGGISTYEGDVSLTSSTVSGNSTAGGYGGGISTFRGDVSLTGSTVSGNSTAGNYASGGGIHTFDGYVSLTGSTVSGNSTAGNSARGGGIHTFDGDVSLTGSTVTGNSTTGNYAEGGGVSTFSGNVSLTSSTVIGNSTGGNDASGGGIFAISGGVSLTSSTVSGNSTAGEFSLGGGIRSLNGISLTDSTVSSNSTAGNWSEGGGISNGYGDVSLNNSTVSGNSITGDYGNGGGISASAGNVTLNGSAVSGNSTVGSGVGGGGISMRDGDVSLNNSTVSGNSTTGSGARGGGISIDGGNLSLTGSTVSGNSTAGDSSSGGGIFSLSGNASLTNSTVSGNSTSGNRALGGGIYAAFGNVSLTSSTVSGNSTSGNNAVGGGIAKYYQGNVSLTNSTVSGNSAAGGGGGVFLYDWANDPTLSIENSIVAGNLANKTSGNSGTPNDLVADPGGTVSINHSLIGVADGLTITGNVGNQTGTAASPRDPLLGPLADNGGPTLTHALQANSPAIDAGDPSILFNPAEFDQRGTPHFRVFGAFIDIGSLESQPPIADIGGPYSGDEGSPIALSGSASTAASVFDWDLDNDGQYDDASGENVNFVPTDNGVFTIGLRINGPGGPTDSTTVTVGNLAPTAGVAGPASGVPFQPRTFTLTATDPSPVDQAADFSFDIDWDGDSVVDETIVGPSGTQIDHAFPAVNNNTVRVTATDKDSGVSTESTHAINIVRVEMQGTDLVWGGTTGEDAVEFEETAASTVEIRATLLDGVVVSDTQTFVGVSGRVIAYGGDKADIIDAGGVDGLSNISATLIGGLGHDTIYGGDAADIIRGDAEGDGSEGKDVIYGGGGDDLIYGDGMEGAADTIMGGDGNDTIYGDNGDISGDGAEGHDVIYGDDGDDMLYGGRRNDTIFGGDGNDTIDGQTGNDILSGGAGNDTLTGGDGKDLLFAGSGADTLYGGAGGDLLVAGTTSFDFIEADLKLIGKEWWSSGSYATRIANISGTPGGANDPVFLQPGITVLDDADIDTLFGDGDDDWFLDSKTGLIPDILSDLQAGEVETDIA